MLVSQHGCIPNAKTQICFWEGDDVKGDHEGIESRPFFTTPSQVLIQQLAVADQISEVAGPNVQLTVFGDCEVGYLPTEAMPVTDFLGAASGYLCRLLNQIQLPFSQERSSSDGTSI